MPERVDAAGNLRAIYSGVDPAAPRLLVGSHLDTVPNAGAYDGILGVVLAVALLQALQGRRLPYGIELVGFSEEEGVRLAMPFIGSRALVGRLDAELRRGQTRGESRCGRRFRILGRIRLRLGRPRWTTVSSVEI